MHHKRKNKDFNPHKCGVTHFLNLMGGKWKVLVVHGISMNVNRFVSLKKAIPAISKQTLVNLLRELEEDNVIKRITYNEMPARVEYELTEYGAALLPIIRVIDEWGKSDMNRIADN